MHFVIRIGAVRSHCLNSRRGFRLLSNVAASGPMDPWIVGQLSLSYYTKGVFSSINLPEFIFQETLAAWITWHHNRQREPPGKTMAFGVLTKEENKQKAKGRRLERKRISSEKWYILFDLEDHESFFPFNIHTMAMAARRGILHSGDFCPLSQPPREAYTFT